MSTAALLKNNTSDFLGQTRSKKIVEASISPSRDRADLEVVEKALFDESGLAGTDNYVSKYEERLKSYFGSAHAIAVSSGTASIHSALYAAGVSSGDEVLVPALAAVMSAIPILEIGAIPIFVDCCENSIEFNLEELASKVTPRTKAVLSVPMWGIPTTSTRLKNFCREKDLTLIVDAAQATGTIVDGTLEGTDVPFGCFSTHEIKLISTGEGGFILTDDPDNADRSKTFVRIGNNIIGDRKGFGEHFGLNYKFNSLSAALGISQVNKLQETLQKRRMIAQYWMAALASRGDLLWPFFEEKANQRSNCYSLVYLIDDKITRQFDSAYIACLLNERGIGNEVYKYSLRILPDYPIFRPYCNSDSRYPNATSILKRLLVLPTHQGVNRKNLRIAAEVIIEVLSMLYNQSNSTDI